jgi:preprotein translocase subunit SecF
MGKFSRLGNDLYSGKRSIDFVGRRWLWYGISGAIVLVAVAGLFFKGINYGIEFTGGAEYRVSLPASKVTQGTADDLRQAVAGTGIDAAAAPVVTTSGTDSILVQTEPVNDQESAQIVDTIVATTGVQDPAQDISQSEIGASWGKEVAQRALLGLGVFLVLVVLFIWAYFRQWKMSAAALVALAHDVIITIGVYALSGFEVSPATVTGLLTILGFSLYDTVVVFDKVRENTKDLRSSRLTYAEAANRAVNQTLVRSINTSIVALIPVGCILYVGAVQLGSGAMKDLALALFVGMAAGVYSSIFIATPLLAHLKSRESEVLLAEKRAKARRRENADRYASVPAFTDDMPVADEPGVDSDRPATVTEGSAPTAPPRTPEATGRGRVAPSPQRPVQKSAASGRQQPSRQPRSKRGRK